MENFIKTNLFRILKRIFVFLTYQELKQIYIKDISYYKKKPVQFCFHALVACCKHNTQIIYRGDSCINLNSKRRD